MPANFSPGRTHRPWLRWGFPITVVVLLMAASAGIASRGLYSETENSAKPDQPHEPLDANPQVVRFNSATTEHPEYNAVRSVLQNHFDSINGSNYDRWQTTVVEQRERDSPESEWLNDYASTSDRNITVHRINEGPGDSLRVFITFTSHQNSEDAPDGVSPCLRWRVVYPLVRESGELLMDTAEYNGSSLWRPC